MIEIYLMLAYCFGIMTGVGITGYILTKKKKGAA